MPKVHLGLGTDNQGVVQRDNPRSNFSKTEFHGSLARLCIAFCGQIFTQREKRVRSAKQQI